VLAERAGVARETAYDVLQASAAGAPLVQYKRAGFLEPESTPTTFSLDLAAKDLRLITALGGRLGVPVAQALTNLELIEAAAASEGAERDFADVASHVRRRAGEREEASAG
jgi:3-hydroxyisobutyrate dehydrogenase-like beta-hydroxyacid dehydrogenase